MTTSSATLTGVRMRVQRCLVVAITAGSLIAVGLSTPPEAAAKPFKMSEAGLKSNCTRYGGSFYSYPNKGTYGCSYKDNSATDCKKGVCNHVVVRVAPPEQTRVPTGDGPGQPDPVVPPPDPRSPQDDVGAAG